MEIEKTENFTIYKVDSEKFRIVQESDKEFVIEKLCKNKETKGILWWKKTREWEVWRNVDIKGHFYFRYSVQTFKKYKTLGKAIKWIQDYEKYPVTH